MLFRCWLLSSLLLIACETLSAQPNPSSTPPPLSVGAEIGLQLTNYRFQNRAEVGSDVLDIRSPYRLGLWLGLPLSWHFQQRWSLRLALALSLEQSRVELGYPGDSLAERLIEPYNLVLPLTIQWYSSSLDQPHLLLGAGPVLSFNLRADPDSLAEPEQRAVRRIDGGAMGYLGLRLPFRVKSSRRWLTIKGTYRLGLGNVLRAEWPIPGVSVLNQQAWMLSLVIE